MFVKGRISGSIFQSRKLHHRWMLSRLRFIPENLIYYKKKMYDKLHHAECQFIPENLVNKKKCMILVAKNHRPWLAFLFEIGNIVIT